MTAREMYDDHRKRHPELYPDYSRKNSKLECPPGNVPLEAKQGQAYPAGRIHIRFVSFRKRLCDPDNLSVKWLLDCLRYCGAIDGDEPDKITLEVHQEKVKLQSSERTEITISPAIP